VQINEAGEKHTDEKTSLEIQRKQELLYRKQPGNACPAFV
jgi:hypothetical protein